MGRRRFARTTAVLSCFAAISALVRSALLSTAASSDDAAVAGAAGKLTDKAPAYTQSAANRRSSAALLRAARRKKRVEGTLLGTQSISSRLITGFRGNQNFVQLIVAERGRLLHLVSMSQS